MKRTVLALLLVGTAAGAYWITRPAFFDTGAPLVASSGPVKLLDDLNTEALTEGWGHRTFFRVTPAEYRMLNENGKDVLQCGTDNSASILARDTRIALADLPILSWRWKVTQPISSNIDEATKEGDDHPVRFFLQFSDDTGENRSMEIIWSNKKFAPGEYKIIGSFLHYVANGLDENTQKWHEHSVDLRQLYKDIGGTGIGTLETLGFFCDSDNTGAYSEGYFSDIQLSAQSQ
ncbi:MAG: DUF3047 domain-containing protein [Sulfitobacter sp.]